jgi:hypothetical protein
MPREVLTAVISFVSIIYSTTSFGAVLAATSFSAVLTVLAIFLAIISFVAVLTATVGDFVDENVIIYAAVEEAL